jgi:hypothetical protein
MRRTKTQKEFDVCEEQLYLGTCAVLKTIHKLTKQSECQKEYFTPSYIAKEIPDCEKTYGTIRAHDVPTLADTLIDLGLVDGVKIKLHGTGRSTHYKGYRTILEQESEIEQIIQDC